MANDLISGSIIAWIHRHNHILTLAHAAWLRTPWHDRKDTDHCDEPKPFPPQTRPWLW